MSVRGYWFAFAIGVTAGAAVALLYAPQAGAKTRKKLRSHMENAGDYLEDASEYLKDRADRFSSDAQNAVKVGKKHIDSVADVTSDLAATTTKKAKSMI